MTLVMRMKTVPCCFTIYIRYIRFRIPVFIQKNESVIFNFSGASFLAPKNAYRLENQPVLGVVWIICIKNKVELKTYLSVIYFR